MALLLTEIGRLYMWGDIMWGDIIFGHGPIKIKKKAASLLTEAVGLKAMHTSLVKAWSDVPLQARTEAVVLTGIEKGMVKRWSDVPVTARTEAVLLVGIEKGMVKRWSDIFPLQA